MTNKKGQILALFFIFGIAFLFRFWKLSHYPVSLSIDEVIIGYDAYSVLKTSRDHWGEFLPLSFKSVGDYKSPVLIYLLMPAIKIFGLNEFGIRFTTALIGSLTPLVAYFLINCLLKNKTASLFSALLLAASPWHIQFSRATFEAVLALFFLMAGILVFLKSLKNKGKWWWLTGFFLSLSMYSYHAEKVFIPALLVSLAVIFRKKIWQFKRNAFLALVVSLLILIPFISLMFSSRGQARARSVFFTNDFELRVLRLEKIKNWPGRSIIEKTLNGEIVNIASFWVKRYLEYSDFSYLFFKGMNYTHPKFPDVGVMYYFELPFFLLGIFVLANKTKIDKEKKTLIFSWLFLGPLPASLANNPQHPLRSLTTLPMPQLISGLGIWYFINWLRKLKIWKIGKTVLFSGLGLVIFISVFCYLDRYYIHYPVHYSHYWMYGMKEAALYAWQNKDQYDQIIFDPDFGIEAKNIRSIPFAYVLTYGQVSPEIIHSARKENNGPLSFEGFVFRNVYWPEDKNLKNALLIASFWQLSPKEIPTEKVVKMISLYNGQPMFYLVETDKE